MEQIFPSPVDNVDVRALYSADERTSSAGRPWVMCNMIASADGGISVDGVSGGLGGPGDKAVFGALRAIPDVIVVASGTVIAENYRKPQTPEDVQAQRVARGQTARPRLAIVTRSLSIDPAHRVFDPEARPLIITTADADPTARAALEEVADIVVAGDRSVDLTDALGSLHRLGADIVLLEGGPTLNGAFVDHDLIDELCLSVSPMLLGGESPRIVARSSNTAPLPLRLDRTLHDDGALFHRYLRSR